MSVNRGAIVRATGTRDDPVQAAEVAHLTYTVGELARALRLSRTLTYASLRDGTIPAERAGRRWVSPGVVFRSGWTGVVRLAVDDLWYRRQRDPSTVERLPSKRHGRGKRWRVRCVDPETGHTRTELFGRRSDAERHDANMQADISRGQYVDPRAGKLTVAEYAEHWRSTLLHRGSTAERTERVVRRHVVPVLGTLPLSQVRHSHIRGWVKDRSQELAPSTLAVVFYGTLVPPFQRRCGRPRIGVSPCGGIRLPDVPDTRYHIARLDEVHALARALPERYRAIVYLAAGCG